MPKNIEPELKGIGEYLRLNEGASFIIPEYQRAYSWGIEQCDKLWNDIVKYIEEENTVEDCYFFGTIILNCQENDQELLLIDGQQRTTTFLLLLKAFLIKINVMIGATKDDEDSKSFRRALCRRRENIMSILCKIHPDEISDEPNNEEDIELLKRSRFLLQNKSIREPFKNDFAQIMQAISLEEAEKNVATIKFKQKDNKYSNYFRNFKFFYGKLNEVSDLMINSMAKTFIERSEIIAIKSWNLEQAITMFNSLNSDSLPLNDADIISSKLYEVAKRSNCEKEFAVHWETFHKDAQELEKSKIADIDAVLMQYMYYERAKRKETLSASGAVTVTTPGLRRYFTKIITKTLSDPLKFSDGVSKLVKFWQDAYNFPCVQVLLKFNENAKLFLASYLYRFEGKIAEQEIRPIAESLLKLFAILEVEDTGYSSKNFKSFLFKVQIKMVDPNVPMQEIEQDFKQHILDNWKRDELARKISGYDKNMLVYLNEYLYAREHNLDFNLESKYDIEHIMPASGRNKQIIQKDAAIKDGDEFKELVNALGNKILLEYSINRSIGNEWFRTKISTTLKDKTGYIDSKYPIAKGLVEQYRKAEKLYWTKTDIEKATEKAKDRITDFIFS